MEARNVHLKTLIEVVILVSVAEAAVNVALQMFHDTLTISNFVALFCIVQILTVNVIYHVSY